MRVLRPPAGQGLMSRSGTRIKGEIPVTTRTKACWALAMTQTDHAYIGEHRLLSVH